MKNFLVGVRNMTASFFSWLVIVWMIYYVVSEKQNMEMNILWQLLFLSFSWAIIFTFFYSTNIATWKKITPTKKFTLFMVVCTIIESFLIYAFGLFGITTIVQWGIFVCVVFALYAISLGIFELYKRQVSREYAQLLQNYQQDKEL